MKEKISVTIINNMKSVQLEVLSAQHDWFSCTDIVHEFEIRLRRCGEWNAAKRQHRYETGISEPAWAAIQSFFSADPSYTRTTDQYENINYRDANGKDAEIRQRKGVFMSKVNVSTNDLPYLGFEFRLSESSETIIKNIPEGLVPSFSRKINRTTYTKRVEHGEIQLDFSIVINKEAGSNTGIVTREIELEFKPNQPKTVFMKDVIPVMETLVSIIYKDHLPPLPRPLFLQRHSIKLVVERMQRGMNAPLDGSLRSLAFNLKPPQIPTLSDYALTNKLDGERKFIYLIPSDEAKQGLICIMNSTGPFEMFLTETFFCMPHEQKGLEMVLDVEYEHGAYYTFDLIYYKDTSRSIRPVDPIFHKERMDLVFPEDIPLVPIVKKKFYYDNLPTNLQAMVHDNPDPTVFFQQNDGLIFTPKNASYADTHAKKPHLKFKFSSKLSVDFYVERMSPSSKDASRDVPFSYYLFSNNYQADAFFRNSREKRDQPFGVLNSLVQITNRTVIECIRISGKWVMLRSRPDRDKGNNPDVIRDVMEDMDKPLQINNLCVVPESIRSYVEILNEKNKVNVYDTYLGHIITLCASILPMASLLQVFTVLLGYANHPYTNDMKRDFHSILYKMGEEATKPINDTVILDQIADILAKKYRVGEVPLYVGEASQQQPPEVEEFVRLYDSMFPNDSRAIRSMMDVRRFGIMHPDENKTCIARHSYVDTTPVATKPLPITPEVLNSYVERHFPKKRGGITDYPPYGDLYVVESSEYSILKPWQEPQVDDILKAWFPFPYQVQRIVDTTAHIGVDSLHFAKFFPSATIDAFEVVPETVVALGKNIQLFHKENTIHLHFQDASGWTPTEPIDIIYMDPPWGGPTYDQKSCLDLYLQRENEARDETKNVNFLIDQWMATKLVSNFILKAPFNFNKSYLMRKYKVLEKPVYNRGKQLAYTLLLIQNTVPFLYKPKSKMTVWSVPYYTSYDPMFFNTESVVMRVPQTDQPMEMLVATLQYYLYSPISFEVPKMIQPQSVIDYAKEHGFMKPRRLTIYHYEYLLFTKQDMETDDDDTRSQLKNMRWYHNTEKRYLIKIYAKNRSVLDLGAGFGGDLAKYDDAGSKRLILVEPSVQNLLVLKDRLDTSNVKPITTLVHAKGQDWATIQPYVKDRVECVSSFFSLTFLFESIDILRGFLHTVDQSLEEGGYFIGTMMSGEKIYKSLEHMKNGDKKKIGQDITIQKRYNNGAFVPGMELFISIVDTIVTNQTEYLAFFSILQRECEALGFKLVKVYDFDPPEKQKALMQPFEIEFSQLNIGFVFQKLPNVVPYPTPFLKPDVTFQFMNLYKESQILVRTGVEEDFSFYRSFLYNISSEYRKEPESRHDMSRGLFVTSNLPENMPLSDIPVFMKIHNINVYVIDSKTRRPIKLDGYDIARAHSVVIMHEAGRYEPVAVNCDGVALRDFPPINAYIGMIHHAMKAV